jgi:hypothetical protein
MSEKGTSKGQHVGRVTELGCVTYYFTSERLYEVTCNCGVTFMVQPAKASRGSLGCKDCIRAMQAAYGKKGNAITNKATKSKGN